MIYNREELFLVQQNKKRIILGNKILDIMHLIMKMGSIIFVVGKSPIDIMEPIFV